MGHLRWVAFGLKWGSEVGGLRCGKRSKPCSVSFQLAMKIVIMNG